jgi:hypothetical protein
MMPPMRSVASSPDIHSQPNNRYVKQPLPYNGSTKSSFLTTKSQQSLRGRSNKTQCHLRELGAKLQEIIKTSNNNAKEPPPDPDPGVH